MVPEPGDYLTKFYILMFCNKPGCEDAHDFISITVSDAVNENSIFFYKEYLLVDLEMEKKWIQCEVRFHIPSTKANVKSSF